MKSTASIDSGLIPGQKLIVLELVSDRIKIGTEVYNIVAFPCRLKPTWFVPRSIRTD